MINIKQIIKSEHLDMLVDGTIPKEPLHIGIKKNFETACWSYNLKAQKHSIYIGDKALDKVTKKGKLGIEYYLGSLLHHEMSHALNTHRDIGEISKWCNKNKVPFSLFNFFEDARIEYLWRVDTDRDFNWTQYEDLPEVDEDSNATTLIFVYIQKEGRFVSPLPKLKRVREYYDKILDCPTSTDLYPILLEWIEEFPETQDDLDQLSEDGFLGDSSNPLSSGDLSTTAEMQCSSEASEKMDEDVEDVIGKSPYNEENSNVELVEELTEVDYDFTSGNTYNIFDENYDGYYNKKQAEKLMPLMQRIFKGKKRKISQSNPSNRLNVRSFTQKRFDKLYKKKMSISKGKKTINLIIDCSGSMCGDPITDARTFCYMINEFAKKGFVQGHLILTGADCSTHQTMTFKFPLKDEDIGHIIADGSAEGLAGTISKTKKLMKKADWNFCITDGNITDNAIDSKGLHLFGMYVGDSDYCNLSKWFEHYLARNTLEELIQKLIIKL